MDKFTRKSKFIFPVIALIFTLLSGYSSFKLQAEVQKMIGTELAGTDGNILTSLNKSLGECMVLAVIGTVISVALAYLICRLISKKINGADSEIFKDFTGNHFGVMIFKYAGEIIGLALTLILGIEKTALLTAVLLAIKVALTVAGAALIFNVTTYKNGKNAPNIVLYGIMSLF